MAFRSPSRASSVDAKRCPAIFMSRVSAVGYPETWYGPHFSSVVRIKLVRDGRFPEPRQRIIVADVRAFPVGYGARVSAMILPACRKWEGR